MKKIYSNNIVFQLLKNINKEEQRDILAIVNNLLSTSKNFDRDFFQYQLKLTFLTENDTQQLLIQEDSLKENYELIMLEDLSIEGEKYLNLLLEFYKQNYSNQNKIDKTLAKLSYDKKIKNGISEYIRKFINGEDTPEDRKIIQKEILSSSMKSSKSTNQFLNKMYEKFAFSSADGKYGIKYLSGNNQETIHIFVNGFTNDKDENNYNHWIKESKDILDEDDTLYGYDWASGKELHKSIKEIGKKFLQHYDRIPEAIASIFVSIGAEWKQARNNSENDCEKLAHFIEKKLLENQMITINLYGHSLGANLLHHTLKHLYNKKLKVNDVFLFGGASEIDKESWTESLCAANNIYNYYSKNDKILTYLYQSMEWCQPIGLNPIVYNQKNKLTLAKLYNYDVSNDIKGIMGHTEYITKFNFLYRWKYRE